jgi:hypothetical protein
LEKTVIVNPGPPFLRHLASAEDLVTTYEATRAGFVALVLERNRRATPIIAQARALQAAATAARVPQDLLHIRGVESALLAAAGLSDKSLPHLAPTDKAAALSELIEQFLEPAGDKFVEELVFRFLLTRGDTLGGSMRNVAGAIAQSKLTRAILGTLAIHAQPYFWRGVGRRTWLKRPHDDSGIEHHVRGLHWSNSHGARTLLYNLRVPIVDKNVDLCLFKGAPAGLATEDYLTPNTYLALGELKGGIDPAGADEHWKTASKALDRIRKAFAKSGNMPAIFFICAAIERSMAQEIWRELQAGTLTNAANLNDAGQLAALAGWLCEL